MGYFLSQLHCVLVMQAFERELLCFFAICSQQIFLKILVAKKECRALAQFKESKLLLKKYMPHWPSYSNQLQSIRVRPQAYPTCAGTR
jgi:hypothetical protein